MPRLSRGGLACEMKFLSSFLIIPSACLVIYGVLALAPASFNFGLAFILVGVLLWKMDEHYPG